MEQNTSVNMRNVDDLMHDYSRSKRHRAKAKRILVGNVVQFFVVCPSQVIDTQ
jgi:hypothetical protein